MFYTNKKKTYLLFLILYFLPTNLLHAQVSKIQEISKQTHESLNKIQTLVFKITLTKKSFTSRDTIKQEVFGILKVPENKNKTPYYSIISKNNKHYTLYKHDGKHISFGKINIDSLDFLQKIDYYYNNNSIYISHKSKILRDLNINPFFTKKNVFNYYRKFYSTWFAKGVEIKEYYFKDTPVYIFSIYGNNQDSDSSISNSIIKYYIRKEDYLPIAYSFYGEFQGMKQTEFTEIEYLEINPDISLETFKIDPLVKEIEPKAYFDEMQKYNL